MLDNGLRHLEEQKAAAHRVDNQVGSLKHGHKAIVDDLRFLEVCRQTFQQIHHYFLAVRNVDYQVVLNR